MGGKLRMGTSAIQGSLLISKIEFLIIADLGGWSRPNAIFYKTR